MGLFVSAQKVADDGRLAKYSFTTGDSPERILLIDREADRIWPEDGNRDGIFGGAAQAIVRAWQKQGELPDRALHQA